MILLPSEVGQSPVLTAGRAVPLVVCELETYSLYGPAVEETIDRQLDEPRCIAKTLHPGGHYMYHKFNIQQFYVLPTQCVYVFCVDLRTNSHYFPIQH